jgi:nucleotide-binding universal stress UspA family protein
MEAVPGFVRFAHIMSMSSLMPEPPIDIAGSAAAVIVVGVDGSKSSWNAFWWSCGEAQRRGGRIVAVFVSSKLAGVEAAAGSVVGTVATDFYSRDQALYEVAEQLRHQLERYARDARIENVFMHSHGDAALEVFRIATALHADLIVVGKSSKIRHRIAGSLGARLIGKRHAPIVVVVP